MMKNYFLLLLLFALSSCSTFDRMKYRHLKKVPATPQEFSSLNKNFPKDSSMAALQETSAQIPQEECNDSVLFVNEQVVQPDFCADGLELRPQHATTIAKQPVFHHLPIRRDWSLLIGTLLIAGGLIMLSLCIFYFPTAGISFLFTIAFELASLFAAWRMLGTGVMYFVTRFRRRRNFSER